MARLFRGIITAKCPHAAITKRMIVEIISPKIARLNKYRISERK